MNDVMSMWFEVQNNEAKKFEQRLDINSQLRRYYENKKVIRPSNHVR